MTKPPDIDINAGMLVYASATPKCIARVRSRIEDFQVREIIGIKPSIDNIGIPIYMVEKFGIDTIHLARILSFELRSRVKYLGLKDKRAFAVQYIAPTSKRCRRPIQIQGKGFKATLMGYIDRQLRREDLIGNHFKIILRECCKGMESAIDSVFRLCNERRLPNFYGLQRFGRRGLITHRIGREIVKKQFRRAVEILLCEEREGDSEDVKEARRKASEEKYELAFKLFTPRQDIERIVAKKLSIDPNNYLQAIRCIPINVRRLFVSAYQSYIFNVVLSKAIEKGEDISAAEKGDIWAELSEDNLNLKSIHSPRENPNRDSIPLIQLIGYSYRVYGSRFDPIIKEVMEDEGIQPKDFYIKELQELSLEGGLRRAHISARDMNYECLEQNSKIEFTLARGEFATTILREIIKPSDPIEAGL